VRVRFFAAAREAVGAATDEVEVPEGARARDLLDVLAARRGERLRAALAAPGTRIAVNQELVDGDIRLAAGDEVAYLPPVTGG
jgi:molybdopterin synthase sulfur carrier subunit